MIYYVETLTSFIEIYVYYSLLCVLQGTKKSIKIKMICSVVFTAFVLYLNSISIFSFFTLLISPIILAISAKLCFKFSFKFALSFSLFYALFIQIFDSILASCLGLIIGREDYIVLVTTATPYRLGFLIIDKAIFFAAFLLARRYLGSKSEFVKNKYLLPISIGGLAGAIYLMEKMMEQVNVDIALSSVFFAISIILMIIVVHFYYQQQHERESLKFVEMRNELLETNYNSLKELYEANSKLFHDFKNHIRVIGRLVDENNMEELRKYVADFELKDRQGNTTVWTEDTVVNFILNNKISLGQQMGIQVNAYIDFPLKTNIKSNDMTTILANLFDNAIEACNRIPNGEEKKIDVTIRRINEMLIVKFENTCYQEPMRKDDSYISLKINKHFHGWGLKSVESTVKKYGGELNCNYDRENKKFKTVLNLSFVRIEEIIGNKKTK